MSWSAVTLFQPFISPKKRLGTVAFIVVIVITRIVVEYLEAGFSPKFFLYAGFALVASIFEWRHFNKPRDISLKLENGLLEYNNQYTAEIHTVYQSRTQYIQEEADALLFHSVNNYTTRIPLKFFEPEQVCQLKSKISDWDKKLVT